jgi:hypothetical protein
VRVHTLQLDPIPDAVEADHGELTVVGLERDPIASVVHVDRRARDDLSHLEIMVELRG